MIKRNLKKRKININIIQLLKCSSHLSNSSRNWDNNLIKYILGTRNNILIINLEYSLFFFRRSLLFLSNILKNYFPIYLVNLWEDKNFLESLDKNNKGNNFKHIYLKKKFILYVNNWEPGFLSNVKTRYKNKIKKKNKKKFLYPNLLLLIFFRKDLKQMIVKKKLDSYKDILNESLWLNIPSMGLISSDINPFFFDYFILINNDSLESTFSYKNFILSYVYFNFYKKNIYKFFSLLVKKYYKRNDKKKL